MTAEPADKSTPAAAAASSAVTAAAPAENSAPAADAPPATAAATVATPTPELPLLTAFDPPLSPEAAKKKARSLLIIRLVALAMVVVPGIFWIQTWFGTSLSDDQIQAYLDAAIATPPGSPDYDSATRHAFHALNQISSRLSDHAPGVGKFFPALVKLADHPASAIRRTDAWVMGDVPGNPMLQAALIRLAADDEPIVRYNAALALSKYQDPDHARPVLTAMLQPFAVPAPVAGEVRQMIAAKTFLHETMQVCVLATADGKTVSVIAPLKGRALDVQAHEGDPVQIGQTLCLLQPNPDQVLGALVGMTMVGRAEDIKLLRTYTQAGNGDMIRQQAQSAIIAIETRIQGQP